jgi:hypothetical protein
MIYYNLINSSATLYESEVIISNLIFLPNPATWSKKLLIKRKYPLVS